MKRTLAALLSLCCVLTFALTACGGETTTAKPFDLDTLPQALLDSGAFTDPEDMQPAMAATVRFDTLDAATVTDSAAYCSTYLAELLAVLVMEDEAAAEAAVSALQTYVDENIEAERSYRPDEVSKLENAILERRGNAVLLIVASDADAARSALNTWSE